MPAYILVPALWSLGIMFCLVIFWGFFRAGIEFERARQSRSDAVNGPVYMRRLDNRRPHVATEVRERGGLLWVWAWCDLSQTMRQFRIHQISTLVHPDTGEVTHSVDIAAWFAARSKRRELAN